MDGNGWQWTLRRVNQLMPAKKQVMLGMKNLYGFDPGRAI